MNEDLALFVLRVVIGVVVMAHGLMKIGWPISTGQRGMPAVRGVAGFFDGLGFWPPMFWAVVSILAETVGGLLTILGLGGPIGPGLIFGDMLIVTIVAHWPQGFWVRGEKAGIEFPLPITAAALAIALLGNGGWSLDALLGLTYHDFWIMVWLVTMVAGDVALLAIRAGRRREA